MKSKDVIRIIEADGWRLVEAESSHCHYKHPTKPGKVTVPHPERDIPIGTLWSIWKQAGLPKRRS